MSTQEPSSDPGQVPDSGHNASGNGIGNGALTTIENRAQPLPALGYTYGPPPRPDILSAKPNPVELLHAVRRRWPLAIGLGVLVSSIAAGLLMYFIPVRYEAFALLKVSSRSPTVLIRSATGGDDFTVFKRTQVQLILSSSVLQRTVTEPEINRLTVMREHNNEPAVWLKGQLMMEYPDDAEVLRVAFKAAKANEAKKVVDTVVDKYLQEIVQHDRDLRNDHELKLQRTFDTYTAEVKALTDTVHKLETLHKTSSTEAAQVRRRLEQETLGQYTAQKIKLATQIAENSMQIMLMEARRDNADEIRPSDAVLDIELNKDPIIARLSQDLAGLNEALIDQVSRSRHPESSKLIVKLRERIQRTEDAIDERKVVLKPKLMEVQLATATGGQHAAGPQLSLPMLEKLKDYLEAMYKAAEASVAEQAKVLTSLDEFNVAVVSKLEELHAKQRITGDLRAELDRIAVERLAPERITQVDTAVLANAGGDALRKYVAVGFAIVLGFGLVVLGVAFVEFQSRTVNNVHEVHDGLGIRVLGELPNVSGRTWRKIKGGKGPALLKALMAERIDGARTNVIHTTTIEPPRVVLITSALPHEGKTTTASQLAASLARSGRRTLLIDADIRNPGAHRVFEMPQEPGLCELLRGEAERDAVVHPTRTANLWLLPAGRCDLRSVQTLSTSYLGTTLAGLCVQFDYVVIDSGPVLKVADPLLVGQHVDAAILSVLRDVSKVPNVYEACERLRSVGITVLGAVVNGVNDDVARHGVELLMAETTQKSESAANDA